MIPFFAEFWWLFLLSAVLSALIILVLWFKHPKGNWAVYLFLVSVVTLVCNWVAFFWSVFCNILVYLKKG